MSGTNVPFLGRAARQTQRRLLEHNERSAKCRSSEHNSWQCGKYQALTAHVERKQFSTIILIKLPNLSFEAKI